MAGIPGHRVVVFLQENKTTDFYFPSLAEWGAAVANHGALLTAPPNFDQLHDRNAWVHYSMGDYTALAVQLDNDSVIPYYSYLAKEFVFADHHFGAGSNSTSGHMLAVGGQTPTIKNPPSSGRTRYGTCHRSSPPPTPATCPGQHSPTRAGTRPSSTPASPRHLGRPTCTIRTSSSRWRKPGFFLRSSTPGHPPGTTSTRRSSATPATSRSGRTWSWIA